MIDLHTHSSESDGTMSPAELVEAAEEIGLGALALTDHDTVSGIDEAMESAKDKLLEFVPGVEISTSLEPGSLHIVGLYIDHKNRRLREALDYLVESRNKRNVIIIEKLKSLGAPIGMEDLLSVATGPSIGRPHFAEVLVTKGHAKNSKSAFRNYLAKGRPAYAPKEKLKRQEAIEVILAAGGVPILAHPDQTLRKGRDLESLVRGLVDLGLKGIEAYCSGYSTYDNQKLSDLAKKLGLVLSGGSDFHGGIKPGIKLGIGPGSLEVPDTILGPIAKVASQS